MNKIVIGLVFFLCLQESTSAQMPVDQPEYCWFLIDKIATVCLAETPQGLMLKNFFLNEERKRDDEPDNNSDTIEGNIVFRMKDANGKELIKKVINKPPNRFRVETFGINGEMSTHFEPGSSNVVATLPWVDAITNIEIYKVQSDHSLKQVYKANVAEMILESIYIEPDR